MPIILNGDTFANGGSAPVTIDGASASLSAIRVALDGAEAVEVWKKRRTLTGGSVSWNNISTNQTATYCTWTDLGGFSTLSIPFSGNVASANISGDSWSITIQLLFADNSTMTLATYTSNTSNINRTLTANISGKTAAQLETVRVQAVGVYRYSVATNRYTLNNTTIGTSTAA